MTKQQQEIMKQKQIAEQKKKQVEMEENALKSLLEPEAMERLFRIQYVKPEKYQILKNHIISVSLLALSKQTIDLENRRRLVDQYA